MEKNIIEPKEEELEILEVFQSRNKNKIKENHQKYIDSGDWKCSLSPTGAHHKEEISSSLLHGVSKRVFVCKYCQKREMIIRHYDVEAAELGRWSKNKE